MIVEQIPVGSLQTNCYIIGCKNTREAAIVDPGDEADRIFAAIAKHQLMVKYILLTHAHFDHIMACDKVASATKAPVALHEADLPLLKAGGGAAAWNLPVPAYHEPDRLLHEYDELSIGDYTFTVLFTPGHAPGHVSFYAVDAKIIFDGDVLFAGSVGRTDLPGGSHEVLMDSINEKLMVLPDDTIVCPGHGPTTTIGRERATNPFLV